MAASGAGAACARDAEIEIQHDRLFGLDPADNEEAKRLQHEADRLMDKATKLGTAAIAARKADKAA